MGLGHCCRGSLAKIRQELGTECGFRRAGGRGGAGVGGWEAAPGCPSACALGGGFVAGAGVLDRWEQTCRASRGSAAATGGTEPGRGESPALKTASPLLSGDFFPHPNPLSQAQGTPG